MKRDLLEKKNPLLAFQLLGAEKEGTFASLATPSEGTVACYISEIGSVKWQEEMIAWLEESPSRRLFFLPDRVEDLLLIDVKLLDMTQFHLIDSPETAVWEHLFEPWEWLGRSERKDEMERALREGELTLSLYRDSGVCYLKNFIRNLPLETLEGTELEGRFKGIPAVICGAGNSLEKHFQLLKELENQALVFGGGSALLPLCKEEVALDFIAALDPEPPPERFNRQTYFETPLFYQRQVDPTLLQTHQGQKLTFGRSGMFPIEGELLDDEVIDVGWTVTTFMAAIATRLGCNPIYFVGVDLCQSEKGKYASGVEGHDDRRDLIKSVDRYGNPVRTRPDFIAAKEWLELFAKKHPETQFVNLSEGLNLKGIPFGLFEKGTIQDLKGMIYHAFQNLSASGQGRINLQESIERTDHLLSESLKAIAEGKQTLLYEVELDEEPFYAWHLLACWEVWKHLLQKEEVISTMMNPEVEKKVQQLLFFQEITKRLRDEPTQH